MPAARRATAAKKDPVVDQDADLDIDLKSSRFTDVAGKLAYIQTHVSKVSKGGTNDFHKFDYMKESNAIEVLRPMLEHVNAAVVWGPRPSLTILSSANGTYPKTSRGKDQTFVALNGSVIFRCGDTGAEIAAGALGSAADQDDKAVAKAQTVAFKYGLQKLGLLPTDDIDDGDQHAPTTDDEDQAPAPQTSGAPPVPAAAEDAAIGQGAAATIIEGLTGHVQAGELDPNKVKAKLATYQKGEVAALTDVQAQEFLAWVEAEVAKGKAPAG